MVMSLNTSLCKACVSSHSPCSASGLELLDRPIRELQLPTTYTTFVGIWKMHPCPAALAWRFSAQSTGKISALNLLLQALLCIATYHHTTGQWPFLLLLQRAQITGKSFYRCIYNCPQDLINRSGVGIGEGLLKHRQLWWELLSFDWSLFHLLN